VRPTGIETSFNVAMGSIADIMSSSPSADDVVVIIEPRNPAERVAQQFTRLVNAAFATSVTVMMIPSRIARTAGPIVAVISRPDDPGISSAVAIAAAAKERVIVLAPQGSDARESVVERAEAAGVRIEARPVIQELWDVSSLLTQLAHLNERLLVMSPRDRSG